jgi:enoyl-CoA hydratase/carnithine racemase
LSIDFQLLDHGVGHVLINRPERMNALDIPAKKALGQIWREAAAHPGCKVLVLSGAGEKAFCAGSDIKEMQASGTMVDTETLMGAIPGIGVPLDKPVIAAMHGYTVGMGMTLAIHCDFRVAAQGARFSFPEVKHGMLSGVSAVTLSGLVGEAAALDIMLSARVFDLPQACRFGLVSREAQGGTAADALALAIDLGRTIAANSQAALTLTKRLILAERRRKVLAHAALIDEARIAVTRSREFSEVVEKKPGAGRME